MVLPVCADDKIGGVRMKGLTTDEQTELTQCWCTLKAIQLGLEIPQDNYQVILSRYYELIGKVKCGDPPTIEQINAMSL